MSRNFFHSLTHFLVGTSLSFQNFFMSESIKLHHIKRYKKLSLIERQPSLASLHFYQWQQVFFGAQTQWESYSDIYPGKNILVSSPGALVKFPSCFSHRSWAALSSTAELHSLIENLLFFPTEPGLPFHGIVERYLQKASIHAFRTGSLKQHCSLSSFLPLSSVTLQGGAHYLVKGLLFPNWVRRSSSAHWVTKNFVL